MTMTVMLGGGLSLNRPADAAVTPVAMRTARVPSATALFTGVTLTCLLTFQLEALNVSHVGATLADSVLLDVNVMLTGVNCGERGGVAGGVW